jgi:hypothetical protein
MPPTQRKKDTSSLSKNYDPSRSSKNYTIQKKSKSSGGLICLSILQVILTFIIINFASSYFVTETWFWGYEGKYTNWRNWIPVCINNLPMP